MAAAEAGAVGGGAVSDVSTIRFQSSHSDEPGETRCVMGFLAVDILGLPLLGL